MVAGAVGFGDTDSSSVTEVLKSLATGAPVVALVALVALVAVGLTPEVSIWEGVEDQ